MSLPARPGPPPTTTPTNPHTQLDQQPADPSLSERLAMRVFALPGVQERESAISVPGARALWLDESLPPGPPEAFLIGREFAHLHPGRDQSLHAMLPPDLAADAVRAGWAEPHPVARRGLLPANAVMLYAPRDDDELDVVASLIEAAYGYASGSASGSAYGSASGYPAPPMSPSVRVIGPDSLRDADPTAGMRRKRAIDVPGLWAGLVHTEPGATSGWHHHGDYETSLYVISGTLRLEFGPGGRSAADAGPGEFVHVPAHVVHRETNPGDRSSTAVIARAGAGQPTVNVAGPDEATRPDEA
jgi:uncharacterized RmlC-like cupin family protein